MESVTAAVAFLTRRLFFLFNVRHWSARVIRAVYLADKGSGEASSEWRWKCNGFNDRPTSGRFHDHVSPTWWFYSIVINGPQTVILMTRHCSPFIIYPYKSLLRTETFRTNKEETFDLLLLLLLRCDRHRPCSVAAGCISPSLCAVAASLRPCQPQEVQS